MEKQQELDLIAGRIMDEYRKHHNSLPEDWHKIAASKIHSQWKEFWQISVNNPLDEWIDLNKQQPKISGDYLVYKNGEIKISQYRGSWNMFHCDINRNINDAFVTYWRPLPPFT